MKKLSFFVTLALIISILSSSLVAMANRTTTTTTQKPAVTAVLFIHGWNGDNDTFNNMISTLYPKAPVNNFFYTNNDDRIYWYMTKDQRLKTSGNRLIVQLKYWDTSMSNQRKMIDTTLKFLAQSYTINGIQFVTHSMGGLGAWSYYMDCAMSTTCAYKNIPYKIATLASPLNGLTPSYMQIAKPALGLAPSYFTDFSTQLNRYANSIDGPASNLHVLSLAGVADVQVGMDSALYMESKLIGKVNHVSFAFDQQSHTSIHQSLNVMKIVNYFLSGSTTNIMQYFNYRGLIDADVLVSPIDYSAQRKYSFRMQSGKKSEFELLVIQRINNRDVTTHVIPLDRNKRYSKIIFNPKFLVPLKLMP